MRAFALLLAAIMALTVAGAITLPRGIAASELLAGPRDAEAIVQYQLSRRHPAEFAAEAERALLSGDAELAASLATLAAERGHPLPPALLERIAAAEADARSRIAVEAWNGFVSGEAPNEAALAGVVAADLTGVGDIRDLFQQASRSLSGEDVDYFIVGLAGVGLALSAATIASDGLALPARGGVSTLKAARRAGRLSPALMRQVGRIAGDAVDAKAFKAMGASLARLDLVGAKASARTLLNPRAAGQLTALGADVATIGSKAGYRATLDTLRTAETAEDVARTAKLSTRFGKATRAVLVMAGTALTFVSVAASASFWLVSMLLWAAAVLIGLTRLCWRFGRWLWPTRPRLRLQLA